MNLADEIATDEIVHEILEERRRQIAEEGFDQAHDDRHAPGELARAAACYAIASNSSLFTSTPPLSWLWPWSFDWWKPKDNRRNLVRAAALIVAEIERIDRAAEREDAK